MHLSIVIISYNTRELTLACVESVLGRTRGVEFELIVVDNTSGDGSADAIAERFPRVKLLRSQINLGFARANNLAARGARGDWLLLLNPDTVILDAAIERLLAFAEAHPEASIFGGRTIFGDGTLNPASCWRRPTPSARVLSPSGNANFSRSATVRGFSVGRGCAQRAARNSDANTNWLAAVNQ